MTKAIITCMICRAMNNSQPIQNDTLYQAEELTLLNIVQQAREISAQGKTAMPCHCEKVDKPQAGICIECHQVWSPLLLSAVAAEGIQSLYLTGLDQCADCPKAFTAEDMNQMVSDYAMLHQAMLTKLAVIQGNMEPEVAHKAQITPQQEPDRRAFFRNIIPSLAKHAADTVSQSLGGDSSRSVQQDIESDTRPLPLENKLFLHALPKLEINHTPVPAMPSTALGNIQAKQTCTACGDCVQACPSQALALKPFGRNSILEFQAYACIGCNACVSACPEQAIEALPSISLPTLLIEKARPLVMIYSKQ